MSGEKFDALVASLEDLSRRDPVGYKIRVALLALLPYIYLGAVIILALLAVGGICRLFLHASVVFVSLLRIVLPLAVIIFLVCRAFMVRFPPPAGVPVSAADSPKIFELLNELKSKLDCPKIDAVYLNADFNASIRTLPRFGLLGASRHYLCLGLPLMQSLPPEQFRAVLAHELGHLSANHGRFASWIYSVRTNSNQLLEIIRTQAPVGSFLFKHFLEWYSPFFSAYSFVLVRQHEYEADKCAAEISGAATAALSLINTEIKNKYVDLKYWKELFKHVDECPEPPTAPFHDLSEIMVRSGMDPEVYKWYQQALQKITSTSQSHPALKDRIKAIAQLGSEGRFEELTEAELETVWNVQRSAAQEYLQSCLNEYERRMDLAWHHAYDANWKVLYKERVAARKQLELYESKMKNGELSDAELLHRAELFVQVMSSEETIPVLLDALRRLPDNVLLNYNLGERLLLTGDLQGIEYLEKVMTLMPVYGLELCELIYQHLMDEGKEERAKGYLKRAFACREELHQAAKERSGLNLEDSFVAHQINDATLAEIVKRISSVPEIQCAYLVCKDVSTLSDRAFYVVVVELKNPWHKVVDADARKRIVQSLSKLICLPSEGYVIDISSAPANLKKSLESIPDSLIYTAS